MVLGSRRTGICAYAGQTLGLFVFLLVAVRPLQIRGRLRAVLLRSIDSERFTSLFRRSRGPSGNVGTRPSPTAPQETKQHISLPILIFRHFFSNPVTLTSDPVVCVKSVSLETAISVHTACSRRAVHSRLVRAPVRNRVPSKQNE
jgi:hypothetical protein